MACLVNTGVLLRLVVRNDPSHKSIRQSVRAIIRSGKTVYTSAQNIAECWNVCARPRSARGGQGFSPTVAARKLRIIERMFQLVFESDRSYLLWREEVQQLGVKGSKVHDARLVGIMRANGLHEILTLDKADFARFPGIVVIDPASETPERRENLKK